MKQCLGFTLVELLIVIAILGILGTSIIVAMGTGHTQKARDSVRKADLNTVSKALTAFYFDNGFLYPPLQESAGVLYISDSSSGDDWIPELTPVEIKSLPQDPKQGMNVFYLANLFIEFISGNNLVTNVYAQTSDTTFTPTDDTYIKELNRFDNYGGEAALHVDLNTEKDILITFDITSLSGQTINSAMIRFLTISDDGNSDQGGCFFEIAPGWSEGTVTWDIAPIHPIYDPADAIACLGVVLDEPDQWAELDLSSHITAPGVYSFRISSDLENGADYHSKETGANSPQLVVNSTMPSPPPVSISIIWNLLLSLSS